MASLVPSHFVNSKSRSVHPECGFDPHLRHQFLERLRERLIPCSTRQAPDWAGRDLESNAVIEQIPG